MSLVRVAISGASGRMGLALLEAAAATEGVSLGAAVDLAAATWGGVSIGTDVASALENSDVLVDFTRPEGTLANLRSCVAAGRGMVIGTTGFTPAQLAEIGAAARKIPIVMAPNMSVGINVAMKLVELAARSLGDDYDVEVFEMHHRKKVDAPSGTALKLGEVAGAARGTTLDKNGVFERYGTTGERKAGTIGFSVARGGDVVGSASQNWGNACCSWISTRRPMPPAASASSPWTKSPPPAPCSATRHSPKWSSPPVSRTSG